LKEKDAGIVIDKDNENEENQILNPVFDTSSQRSHNKFCIIDNLVWTGSMNPTVNGNTKNNNNVIIIKSKYLAENYMEEFEELYNKLFGKGDKVKYPTIKFNEKLIENYFCPEDNCKEQILKHLNRTKEEIIVMAFSFTDKDIADKLIEKAEVGVTVKVLFEKNRINQQYNVYHYLENTKVQLFNDSNPHMMHHKVFIIDNSTVITGSMNPTKSGNTKNDENIIILQDNSIAEEFFEEFERLTN